jgi:simple sugar transport system ATP-binding protein
MAELMVGSTLMTPKRDSETLGDDVLVIEGLTAPAPHQFGTALKNISVSVKSGEVLGIGGVAGNGQDELVAALSGEMPVSAAMVSLDGQAIGHLDPNTRRKIGLCAAPEERNGHAAAPDMTLTENALMTAKTRLGLSKNGFLDWASARGFALSVIDGFDVRTPGPETAARALSGGNLQKFVIGREILQKPRVLVVNQPTWGVDASAAAAIRQALLDLAGEGSAVVVISQDLDEILEIADRFAALNEGTLSPAVPTAGLTMERIGLMLGGAHDMEAAHVEA